MRRTVLISADGGSVMYHESQPERVRRNSSEYLRMES